MEYEQIKANAKACLDSGNNADAKAGFLQANQLNESDLDVVLGLAIACYRLDEFDRSERWIRHAEALARNTGGRIPAICYLYSANICRMQNRVDEAISRYLEAISVYPNLPIAHTLIAGLYMGLKKLTDAEHHYTQAISLKPDNSDNYANLAQVYEMLGRSGDARNSIARALSITPDHMAAKMALAKLEKREKNFQAAIDTLDSVIGTSTQRPVTAMALIEKAQVFDKQKKYSEAFETISAGKALWSEEVEKMPFNKTAYIDLIADYKRVFGPDAVLRARSGVTDTPDTSGRRPPVFFVGCPRSGTTLMEQILNQHDDIVTSDEKILIDQVIEDIPAICNTSLDYPECIPGLQPQDIERLVTAYWKHAEEQVEGLGAGKILVDKLPLNIIHAGFIDLLFPEAKMLVAMRDPRDACLSCYMQGFTPNPAMVNFLDMHKTVTFYGQIMDLWLQYKDVLELDFYEYRYEDLVSDFDTITRDVFRFLDLDYPEDAADYHVAASQREISTPSYQDVAKPVYQDRKARWHNYAPYFAREFERLSPFITAFGYRVSKD